MPQTISTSDPILNGYLTAIANVEIGIDMRLPLANALYRCYCLAVPEDETPKGGVTDAKIFEHIDRILYAVYGEEVRDALKTGLTLCYTARGISLSNAESTNFTNMLNAQLSEDIKNGFLQLIATCGREVMVL